MEFAEFLVRGALLGVTYGLIACPIALIYVTSGTVDLAIGAYVVLAAATAFALPGAAGMLAAIGAAMVAAAVVGVLSSLLTRRYKGDRLIVILASFGFAIMVESFVLAVYGKDPFVRHSGAAPVELLGMLVNRQSLVSAAIGLLLAARSTSSSTAPRSAARCAPAPTTPAARPSPASRCSGCSSPPSSSPGRWPASPG